MAVGLTARKEEAFELVHLVDEFLTHGLAEGVALSAGEVGEQTRQEHHLLLIDGDSVGVLEIFLHHGDVILYLAAAMLSGDELGDVVHRAGTVEGVHGYEVLEGGGLELAEIFLHTGRLKLEGAGGAALAIELVGLGVGYVDGVDVDVDALGAFDVGECFLDD